jgi:hypothetical protein
LALESATYISDLVNTNPAASDTVSQADDHLRMLKATLLTTFPSITGAVTKTHSQINDLLEKAGGTMTGALVLSGDPTIALHPVTLQYLQASYPTTARTITAGTGLTGGGTLAADRTISIDTGGVGTTQLADNSVTNAKLADNAVSTAEIADNSVTNAKMADNSVDSAEIVAGAVDPSHLSQKRTYDTAQATTSGTTKDFTGIPSWARRVVVMFNNVSLSGTDAILVQIGDSGGLETSSYVSGSTNQFSGATSTSGFIVQTANAAFAMSGTVTLDNVSGNIWVASVCGSTSAATYTAVVGGGHKTLSDVLTQLRVLTTGSNTFDSGSVNIFYE